MPAGLTKLFNLIGSTHYAHKEWINYFKDGTECQAKGKNQSLLQWEWELDLVSTLLTLRTDRPLLDVSIRQ